MANINRTEKKTNSKISLSKRQFLLSLILFLHSLGIIVAFFRTDIPFHYHLLRFFSWWSVHTSIFTVLAAVLIIKERRDNSLLPRKKKSPSYFAQFITLLATMYNLITFFFGVYCLLFLSVGGGKSSLLNCQSFSGHFIAPLLTIFYFYFYTRVDKLRERLVRTLLLAPLSAIFYFFYAWTLAKIHKPTSSLFPHLEKYPYPIFEGIAEKRGDLFIINFLIAALVFLGLCSLIVGTKIICDRKQHKNNSK